MAATRRPIALAAAVATAAALGATFALPALAADGSSTKAAPEAVGAPSEIYQLESGTLDWGLKASFRSMIDRLGGTATLKGGATRNADGSYEFPLEKGEYELGTHAVTSSFKGSVHYEAHGGVLDIKLADVKVLTLGRSGKITVDVTTKSPGEDAVVTDDLTMAELDLTDVEPSQGAEGMKYADVPATFTKEGAAVFGSAYKEGDPIDPATLTVKPATGQPTEQPTGRPTEQPTEPTGQPTEQPTGQPTGPTAQPTAQPSTAPTPTASETAAPVSGPVVDGTLNWGVKEKFRNYVVGNIAHGRIETSGGATAVTDGYRFSKATGHLDADKNTLNAAFKGKVRFLGHEIKGEYVLDLSLSNLKADIKGTSGRLIADVSSRDRATGKVSEFTGLSFADLKVPSGALAAKGGIVNLKGIPATLTEDGSKAFAGMYLKGEELDALNVAVSIDKDAQLPGDSGSTGGSGSTGDSGSTGGSTAGGSTTGGGTVGGSGALASTGSDVPTGALTGASVVVVAAGAGVVIAARRRRDVAA